MKPEKLVTARLVLEGLSPRDMNSIFENHPIPEIKRILGHRSDEEFLKEEYKYKHGYASYNRGFMLFLVKDKTTGIIIGRCGLHNWNAEHRRAEIGYIMVEEAYRRQGLMSEAVKAVLDYGFSIMQLNRIEALVGVENMPSLRILEKFGFTREGLLRQHHNSSGNFEDSVLLAKLFDEYINIHNNK